MENKKYVNNKQGVCPVCGSHDLEWGSSDFQDDYVRYEYECKECHTQGTEWYKLVFDGHRVTVRAQTEAGYKFNYDNVNDYILPEE